MKKILFLSIAAITISSVNAQFNRSLTDPSTLIAPPTEMKMGDQNTAETNTPRKARNYYAYYNRPAGAYVGSTFFKDGSVVGSLPYPFMAVKPNSEYTFTVVKNNMDENWWLCWYYYDHSSQSWSSLERTDNLTVNSGSLYCDMPYLYVFNQNDSPCSSYQLGCHYSDTYYSGIFFPTTGIDVCSGDELLLSSKTMVYGGRFGDAPYMMTSFQGLTPYGNNSQGWWFGKNGQGIDGIAQAFERPEHPYILKQVVLEASQVKVTQEVEMTCKVYQLANGIPAYKDIGSVELPEEPGELIATGRATLEPQANGEQPYIIFTLYGNDGRVTTPTIKDAIFIAIDGYNEPEMENLVDFTGLISTDYEADEGFGELAYIKKKNNGKYNWCGLNNLFSSFSTMKTGLSIFITIKFGDDEHTTTGAPTIDYEVTDDDVTITAIGEGEVLLYIDGELVENPWVIMRGEEDITVIASATAQKAGEFISETVTKEILIPKKMPEFELGDCDGDGKITIGDVTTLIDYLLSKSAPISSEEAADCDGDGKITIGDVTTLIDYLLSGEWTE